MSNLTPNSEFFDILLAKLIHHRQHTPQEVIGVVDALCLLRRLWSKEQWSSASDQIVSLKWDGGYETFIKDPESALHNNPGFYADMVLWQGWRWCYRHKFGIKEDPPAEA